MTLAPDLGVDRALDGDLIKAAERRGFDALITSDKNLRYQQNLKECKIGIVVLPSGQWPDVQNQIDEVAYVVDHAKPGTYIEIPFRRPTRSTR